MIVRSALMESAMVDRLQQPECGPWGAQSGASQPPLRRGLVLGGGGVLGFSWMVGALSALQSCVGFDPRGVDLLVGTSAGSVLAALLAAGLPVDAIVSHQLGAPGDDRIALDYEYGGEFGAQPPRPQWRVGSPPLFIRAARHPRRFPPMAAFSSLLPVGRGSLRSVGEVIDAVAPADRWPTHPATWVVAMDYDSGRRVPFGRQGEPAATLSEAVMASCAIPGWYSPVTIERRRYVDGGTCSATSIDLVARSGLDEVYVLAPMVSFQLDHPATMAARVERRLRRAATSRALREAAKVRQFGTDVILLGPGPEDLARMGGNLMDARRRREVLETSLHTSAEALADERLMSAG
jgi:NTE family protein